MKPQPIQWVTASRKGRSEAANGSRLINMFVEALPADSKSPVVLYGTPGTALFTELPTLPVMAFEEMDGEVYAVTKTNLYTVDSTGAYVDLGAVSLSRRVSIATNGIQLVMVDGNKGYYYSKETGIKELSGPGWYPANTVTYQDGYFIFNRSDTGEFFISDLLSVAFNPLKYATAESAPDDSLCVLSSHRELWIFGKKSTEIWFVTDDPDFPFERISGVSSERGIGAAHSAVIMDNSVVWLGDDGIVYRANGYTPQRISTHAVETDIAKGDISDGFAYTYSEEGHLFYVLTFQSQKKTWVFDAATSEWHERTHIQWGHHHGNCYIKAFNKHLIGDFQNGCIYMLDMAAYSDTVDDIERVMVSPPIHNNRSGAVMWAFELDMESGVAAPAGVTPYAYLDYSDDKGKTWSNIKKASIGKVGEYLKRVKWWQLGRFLQRQVRVKITARIPVVVMGAYAEVTGDR